MVLKLKEFRQKMNMSQSDVADALGMTQQGYFKWEKGLSSPSAKQIKELCKIFNCTPNDLFGFKGVHIVSAEEVFS